MSDYITEIKYKTSASLTTSFKGGDVSWIRANWPSVRATRNVDAQNRETFSIPSWKDAATQAISGVYEPHGYLITHGDITGFEIEKGETRSGADISKMYGNFYIPESNAILPFWQHDDVETDSPEVSNPITYLTWETLWTYYSLKWIMDGSKAVPYFARFYHSMTSYNDVLLNNDTKFNICSKRYGAGLEAKYYADNTEVSGIAKYTANYIDFLPNSSYKDSYGSVYSYLDNRFPEQDFALSNNKLLRISKPRLARDVAYYSSTGNYYAFIENGTIPNFKTKGVALDAFENEETNIRLKTTLEGHPTATFYTPTTATSAFVIGTPGDSLTMPTAIGCGWNKTSNTTTTADYFLGYSWDTYFKLDDVPWYTLSAEILGSYVRITSYSGTPSEYNEPFSVEVVYTQNAPYGYEVNTRSNWTSTKILSETYTSSYDTNKQKVIVDTSPIIPSDDSNNHNYWITLILTLPNNTHNGYKIIKTYYAKGYATTTHKFASIEQMHYKVAAPDPHGYVTASYDDIASGGYLYITNHCGRTVNINGTVKSLNYLGNEYTNTISKTVLFDPDTSTAIFSWDPTTYTTRPNRRTLKGYNFTISYTDGSGTTELIGNLDVNPDNILPSSARDQTSGGGNKFEPTINELN